MTDKQGFECTFRHRHKRMITHAECLADLTQGFWITGVGDWQFTKGSDCKYFIMPHMITEIEKVRK